MVQRSGGAVNRTGKPLIHPVTAEKNANQDCCDQCIEQIDGGVGFRREESPIIDDGDEPMDQIYQQRVLADLAQ